MKSFCENKIKISAVLTNEVFYIILFQYGDEIDFIVKKNIFHITKMISRYFSFKLYTHICGIARSEYAWCCWKCDGLNSRPKHAVAAIFDARVTLIVLVRGAGGVPWLKTGKNSKGQFVRNFRQRSCKQRVGCLQCFGSRAFVNCTC